MEATKKKQSIFKGTNASTWTILAIFIAMCVALTIAEPAFTDFTNLMNVARAFSAYAIAGLGVSMVIMLGGIDISISCTTGDALMAAINAAIDAGIKVVCYDVDSPNSNREYYIGTENYKAGYTCDEYMIDLYKDSGLETVKVAILAGIPGADDIEARIRGFEDAIKDSNIESVYTFACNDNVDEAIEGVEAYSKAHAEEFDAWFMAGGWPYTVDVTAMHNTNAWKLADENHRIVTVDIFPETTPAFFEAGVLDVAVGQNMYNMGYKSVETLVKLIKGEEVEDAPFDETIGAKFVNTGVQIATAADYQTVIGG